jgi:HEAT repeat protein
VAVEIAVGRLRDLVEGPAHLGELIAFGADAVAPLEAFLRGPSESVFQPRCLAADALAAIGGKEAHEALARALLDASGRELPAVLRFSEDAVVNSIATHLGATGDRRFAGFLLKALRAHPFGECARALGRLGERSAVPLLLECLRDDFAREGAMDALESLGEAAVPELTKLLTARPSQQAAEGGTAVAQRASVATVLGRIRGSSEWPLLQALRDEHLEVRVAAALALCERGSRVCEQTVKILSEALDSESVLLAEAAARTLAGAGEPAVARLLEVLGETRLTETDRRRRFAAVHLLGRLGNPSAVPALRLMALDADVLLRQAAAAALGRIPDAPSMKALAQFLDDPEPSVRRAAILSLGARLDESSIRLLAPMLGDPAGRVRREAERTLRKAGTDLVPAFRDALARSLLAHDSLPRRWRIRRASRRLARFGKEA